MNEQTTGPWENLEIPMRTMGDTFARFRAKWKEYDDDARDPLIDKVVASVMAWCVEAFVLLKAEGAVLTGLRPRNLAVFIMKRVMAVKSNKDDPKMQALAERFISSLWLMVKVEKAGSAREKKKYMGMLRARGLLK